MATYIHANPEDLAAGRDALAAIYRTGGAIMNARPGIARRLHRRSETARTQARLPYGCGPLTSGGARLRDGPEWTGRPVRDYGSEGWGFKSLRAGLAQPPSANPGRGLSAVPGSPAHISR
jgi:hypothetical protein